MATHSLRTARTFATAAIACALLLFLLSAGTAQAEPGYKRVGTFGSSVGGVAVDQVTGDILVTNRETWQVEIYAPETGGGASLIGTFASEIPYPTAIAIDQGNGDLYVSSSFAARVVRFNTDRAPIPTYTLDNSFPYIGTENIYPVSLAVDSTSHDFFTTEASASRVARYSQGGDLLNYIDGTGSSGGSFVHPAGIAADGGGALVVDLAGSSFQTAPSSRLERFDATGSPLGSIDIPHPNVVAFNQSNQLTAVIGDVGPFAATPTPRLYLFEGATQISASVLPGTDAGHVFDGVAIGGSAQRIYAASSSIVEAFEPAIYPTLSIDSAVAASETVHFSGTVDPDGQPGTKAHFEYSLDGANWQSTEELDISSAQTVQADVSVKPNTSYRVRLHASNDEVSANSTELTFVSEEGPPGVHTQPASSLTRTSVQLNASINPFGLAATYHFEWGSDTSYGNRVPALDASAGSGSDDRHFDQGISGLVPGATYHYRAVAVNSAGTRYGPDREFTTLSVDTAARSYEMVSQVEKGGTNARPIYSYQAAPDGNSIVYDMSVPNESLTDAGSLQAKYFAARGPDGWSILSLEAPQIPPPDRFQQLLRSTISVSPDTSRALVAGGKAMAPGAVDGQGNLYLRDTSTGAYTLVATSGDIGNGEGGTTAGNTFYEWLVGPQSETGFLAGVTDDYHVFAFVSNVPLLPGAKAGVYKWDEGVLRPQGILPDGTSVAAASAGGTNPMSADGSRLVFLYGSALYMRDDATDKTIAISASHASGDNGELRSGELISVSRDGSTVWFASSGKLTDDAPAEQTIYRYNVDRDEMTAIVSGVGEILAFRDSGNYIYYSTGSEVRVFHDGESHFVIDRVAGEQHFKLSASPSGRYAVVLSSQTATAYDNVTGCPQSGGCFELYYFDAASEELLCASCNPSGAPPRGNVVASEQGASFNYAERIVLDNGRAFFDTPDQLVRNDVNGHEDVYMYDEGRVHLISGGTPGNRSQFAEADATGDNIFFTTNEQLVAQDTDTQVDIYDARVGGGISAQNVLPPRRGECIRDDCKETPTAGPELPFGGSEGLSGPGNVREPARKRCGKGRHIRMVKGKSRCVRPQKKRGTKNRRQGR